MQTLRAGCSKAEPKIFAPPQTPFPGARDDQNLISWRWSPPSPTDPVWWRSMHAISSYRGNRPTNKQTQPQIHRQDRLQYTALQLACSAVSCDKKHFVKRTRIDRLYTQYSLLFVDGVAADHTIKHVQYTTVAYPSDNVCYSELVIVSNVHCSGVNKWCGYRAERKLFLS